MDRKGMLDFAVNHPDLLMISGSHLYGTSTEDSDLDKRGFWINPPHVQMGLFNKDGMRYDSKEVHTTDNNDLHLVPFNKFIERVVIGDMYYVEQLFAPDNKVINRSSFGKKVINQRNQLISKEIGGFHDEKSMDIGLKDHKEAYYFIRVMNQRIELLETGTLTFPRMDAGFLKEIKTGEITYSEIGDIYYEKFSELREACLNTDLPDKPNYKVVNNLIKESVEIGRRRYAC